jgi:hypothetical protein
VTKPTETNGRCKLCKLYRPQGSFLA